MKLNTPSKALGYTLYGGATGNLNPVDAVTYYFGWLEGLALASRQTIGLFEMTVPKAGVITRISWAIVLSTTAGTNESVSHALRVNNSTETTLSTTETYDPTINTQKTFNYTGLAIAVAVGDKIVFKVTCPTWATNPAGMQGSLLIYIE